MKTDRFTPSGGNQVFEDYGDNPNSLYLEAHGFVPYSNPFNCEKLPNPAVTDERTLEVLKSLNVVGQGETLDTAGKGVDMACVSEKAEMQAGTKVYAFYAIVGLGEDPKRFEYCYNNREHRKRGGEACVKYSGVGKVVRGLAKKQAGEKLR